MSSQPTQPQRSSNPFAEAEPYTLANSGLPPDASPTFESHNAIDDRRQRPASRGRDPSPTTKRASGSSLNVLKKRPQQQQQAPLLPSPDHQRPALSGQIQKDPSPRSSPPRQPVYAPPPLPINGYHSSVGIPEQRAVSTPFAAFPTSTSRNSSVDYDPMGPLPLPPRIPGGIHTRNSSRGSSMERPSSSAGSPATGSRPGTPLNGSKLTALPQHSSVVSGEEKQKKRGLVGKLQKKNHDHNGRRSADASAFFVGPNGPGEPYDLTPLIKGRPVSELWHPQGNLLVYVHGKASEPSFRLDSSVIAASRGLQELIINNSRRSVSSATPKMRNMSLHSPTSPDGSHSLRSSSMGSPAALWSPGLEEESKEIEIRLPFMIDPDDPSTDEIDDLVTARNMFGCLAGQLIVGCRGMATFFEIFMSVADMMKRFHFGNLDGSTLGEAGEASFLGYVADLRLDDVRKSREKTIEALVLGERMKCWSLYNEGYVHAVGKWQDLVEKRDPKFAGISSRTRIAIEKSVADLQSRLQSVHEHLDDFQFHGIFQGFAASKSVKQAVDIQAWENAWKAMRKHVISFYKKAYGNWPPRAKSKKNEFEESGLNRILLQDVYRDFTDLYDMLVDRSALTERTSDSSHGATLSDDVTMDHLRKLLSEFDRSITPVRPPIPYDLPNIPSLNAAIRGYDQMDANKQEKENTRKVKGDNLTSVLMGSYNKDGLKTTPFVEAYMTWERSITSGRNANEIGNIRVGVWIFMYVVLQMLPLLVVDAPGLRHTKSVEYFLCQVPKGSPPWMPEQRGQKAYYRIAGTDGVVSMPADIVEHGVEGIFRRSHCWVMASRWSGQDAASLLAASHQNSGGPAALQSGAAAVSYAASTSQFSDGRGPSGMSAGEFAPPPVFMSDGRLAPGGSNSNSPRGSRASLLPGLEALPLPPSIGANIEAGSRRSSILDPTKSFDDILSGFGPAQDDGKKGRKKR